MSWSVCSDQNGSTLVHYGVKGMKWGVRKDRSRAYSKSVKKMRKLRSKEEKAYEKETAVSKAHLNLLDQIKSGVNNSALSENARAKRFNESHKNSVKAMRRNAKAQKKARDWFDKMEKEFKNAKLKNVSSDDLKYMKELTDYYMVYDAVMYEQLFG